MSDSSVGICLLVIAGVMTASCTVPMKFARRWAWEHESLAWSVLALLLLPLLLSALTIPDLRGVYIQAGWLPLGIVLVCGLGWGIGQIFLAFSMESMGRGFASAIAFGVSAAVGSIVSLLNRHADKLYSPTGMSVIVGVVLVIVGVGLCAAAGRRRQIVLGIASENLSFARGFLYCCIAGAGAALLGLGLEWGGHIVRAAKAAGADEIWRPNAVWLAFMVAGAIPILGFSIYRIRKNKNGSQLIQARTATYWLLALGMAILWFGSTVTYGVSTVVIGSLGAAITWPVYMTLIVIATSTIGLFKGEWQRAGGAPLAAQITGIAILILAIVVFSRAL